MYHEWFRSALMAMSNWMEDPPLRKRQGEPLERMSDASSSSSSLIKKCIEDLMLTDSIENEDNSKPKDSCTVQFVDDTIPAVAATQNLPTHCHGTLHPTVNNAKTVSAAADVSSASSLMASVQTTNQQNSIHTQHSHVETPSKTPISTNRSNLKDDNSETTTENEEDDRKPSFQSSTLPQNNSAESFPNMSVSSTPPSNGSGEEKKTTRQVNKHCPKDGQSSGRWTEDEHQAFLRGLHTYGREWKKVASHIPTRTSAQVRSHAQKYFAKLQKEEDSWAGSYVSTEGTGGMAATNAAGSEDPSGTVPLSSSVQANVARIMARPETVEAEVEDTLRQLRARYEALQRRLEQTSRGDTPNRKRRSPHPFVPDDQSSATSLSVSLQNEELIALSVLQGGLPAGDASLGGSESLSDEQMENASNQTESTGSLPKRAKHD